jgi:RNA ligase (TIGR02306 family)
MATIRKIAEIRPIIGADLICAYRVDGWWVVDQVNKYLLGDLVVYAEPDSWIPHELAPFLSRGNAPRTFEQVLGERLRTVRLRGQLSQGLLLPITVCTAPGDSQLGDDVSESLNILKYEAPIPACIAGEVTGALPGFIPKTDQERIQNLTLELAQWTTQSLTWEVTEKLDGSSMTVFWNQGLFGVCSRNWQLADRPGNTPWRVAGELYLKSGLEQLGRNLALQGELIGNDIQDNRYARRGQTFMIFDIFDIDAGEYLTPDQRTQLVTHMGWPHVPVIASAAVLTESMDQLLLAADSRSSMPVTPAPWQEGLVYKCNQLAVSFKVISNKFLLRAQ